MNIKILIGIAGLLLLTVSIAIFIFELVHFPYSIPTMYLLPTIGLFLISLILLILSARVINAWFRNYGVSSSNPNLNNRLEKNNQLIEQWNKTMDQRDRLKVLEIAENAQSKK